MEEHIKYHLEQLFENVFNESVGDIESLPQSGSARKYFRLKNVYRSVIGAYNNDTRENIAFLGFTKHFQKKGLKVPEIYAESLKNQVYLQQDLGDTTLFKYLSEIRTGDEFPEEAIIIYKKALSELANFQITGHEELDYSIAFPRFAFDKQSMMWDLNYFKHYFIKLAGVSFYEQDLEDDFNTLTNYLLNAKHHHFLYRDFQSRNIMLHKNEMYFIDYQGGRKGALQYDIASLLYDSKANIPQNTRTELLDHYINTIIKRIDIDVKEFREYYYGYALIRIMQAFGAYGYRGFFERKLHFLQSIPFATRNLKWIIENIELPIEIPTLQKVFKRIIDSPNLKEFEYTPSEGLTIYINSFSYKRNIPLDNTGNGGGFVFDCRFLPNPGRNPKYQNLTGSDNEVIKYLEDKHEVQEFLINTSRIVESAIENYLERGFNHLMVSYGCTGGQHRSVYFANQLFKHLNKIYNINLRIKHIEQEILGNQ